MKKMLVGNAPCSWGTLENQDKSQVVPFNKMLDELVETGYTGTELGDWGYMPTDHAALGAEIKKRNLVMLGAFVPVAMKYPAAHAPGVANAVKTARLLAERQISAVVPLTSSTGVEAVLVLGEKRSGEHDADSETPTSPSTEFAGLDGTVAGPQTIQ